MARSRAFKDRKNPIRGGQHRSDLLAPAGLRKAVRPLWQAPATPPPQPDSVKSETPPKDTLPIEKSAESFARTSEGFTGPPISEEVLLTGSHAGPKFLPCRSGPLLIPDLQFLQPPGTHSTSEIQSRLSLDSMRANFMSSHPEYRLSNSDTKQIPSVLKLVSSVNTLTLFRLPYKMRGEKLITTSEISPGAHKRIMDLQDVKDNIYSTVHGDRARVSTHVMSEVVALLRWAAEGTANAPVGHTNCESVSDKSPMRSQHQLIPSMATPPDNRMMSLNNMRLCPIFIPAPSANIEPQAKLPPLRLPDPGDEKLSAHLIDSEPVTMRQLLTPLTQFPSYSIPSAFSGGT